MLGLASIGLSVIVYVLGYHLEQPWWQSVLSILLLIVIIVLGFKAFKKDNEGYLSLGQALKTGLAIALIAGIIGSIFTLIFVNYIEPNFAAEMLEVTREKMIEQNPKMTEEQLEMAMGMTEKFMTPGIMMAMGLIMSLFLGFIVSLIAGLIMKKNRPE